MSRVRASSVVPSIVALAVVLLFAATPHGQTRPPQQPPKGPTIPQSVRDHVAKNGRVRVIVELRLPGNGGRLAEARPPVTRNSVNSFPQSTISGIRIPPSRFIL